MSSDHELLLEGMLEGVGIFSKFSPMAGSISASSLLEIVNSLASCDLIMVDMN